MNKVAPALDQMSLSADRHRRKDAIVPWRLWHLESLSSLKEA